MKVIIDADVLLYQSLPRDPHSAFTYAVENYNRIKQDIFERCFGTEVITCLSLPGKNFRKNSYPTYKADRVTKDPPEHLFDLKDWALNNDPDAMGSQHGEADDLVLQTAADCLAAGEPYVIASVDKDLKTIPCVYYEMRKREIIKVTEQEAFDFIVQQMIAGDPGDAIPGIYRVGYKTAAKLLDEHATTNQQKYFAARKIWKDKVGEDNWVQGFNDTTNLTFIRRREEDLKPINFSTLSWEDFKALLRFEVPE